MATTQTVNIPGGRTGPNGGNQYRFDFLAADGVTPADRSVAQVAHIQELQAGNPVGPLILATFLHNLETDICSAFKGMNAQQQAVALANWVY